MATNPVTLPVPTTWASGPIRTSVLRANVSDAIALLSRPPAFCGQQTLTGQSISAATLTNVQLDTELYDNYNGHLTTVNPSHYVCQFAGWYLCEGSVAFVAAGANTGFASAVIGGVQNGGAFTDFQGAASLNNNGQVIVPSVAKLMKLQTVGSDYAVLVCENSQAITLSNTATGSPQFSARWVSALSGTSGLGVPSNPAWPVPPSFISSSFLNTNIRDTIRFLIYPPILEAVRASGAGSLASQASIPATGTTVVCDTENVDNYNAYNNSTGVWTAPVAGRYYAYGALCTVGAANSLTNACGLTVTSSNYNGGTTITLWGGAQTSVAVALAINGSVVRKRLRLNAGDTVSLAGFQNSTAATAMSWPGSATGGPRLIIVWEGS